MTRDGNPASGQSETRRREGRPATRRLARFPRRVSGFVQILLSDIKIFYSAGSESNRMKLGPTNGRGWISNPIREGEPDADE